MSYAENTSVSPERSRAEIERTLSRYGADAFSYGWDGDRAVVVFRADTRMVRFELTMPPLSDFRWSSGREWKSRARERTVAQMHEARDKAMRQRWRALALVVKAKLEAVESGITTFDDEFMAHLLLPNGETVGQWMAPQLDDVYETAVMPMVLPGSRLQLGSGS